MLFYVIISYHIISYCMFNDMKQAAKTSRWQLAARSRKPRASARLLVLCSCFSASSARLRAASQAISRLQAPQDAVAEALQEPQKQLVLHRIPARRLPQLPKPQRPKRKRPESGAASPRPCAEEKGLRYSPQRLRKRNLSLSRCPRSG